jgi:hypothetical protein
MCSDARMSRRDDAMVATGTDDIGGLGAERGNVSVEGGSRNKDLDKSRRRSRRWRGRFGRDCPRTVRRWIDVRCRRCRLVHGLCCLVHCHLNTLLNTRIVGFDVELCFRRRVPFILCAPPRSWLGQIRVRKAAPRDPR